MVGNDVWKFVLLDSDTIVLGATLEIDDIDSGTAALIDLGYAAKDGTPNDDDYFLADSTIGQTGGTADSSAARLFMGEDFFVQAKVQTAPGTAVLGNKNAQ
jgi:hypothetical protein